MSDAVYHPMIAWIRPLYKFKATRFNLYHNKVNKKGPRRVLLKISLIWD